MTRRKSISPVHPIQLAALCLAFFAFGASALISRHVFERFPHLEDEFAYLYQAKIFAGGRAWMDRGNAPGALYWQPFMLQQKAPDGDYQRQFSKYTPGWSLVLTPGIWLGQPWIINAWLAMLSVILVYRLGREIFDPQVGLVAALLLACSPMALLLNATLMSHTWAMFATLVFVNAYWRILRMGRGRYAWALIGGLCLGALAATRPLTAVAMAAPVALHSLARLWTLIGKKSPAESGFPEAQGAESDLPPDKGIYRNSRSQKPLGQAISLAAVMAALGLAALPTAGLYPLYNQVTTGDFRANTYTLLWSYDKVGFGAGFGLNKGGHTLSYGWRNARRDLTEWFRDLHGFTLDPSLGEYARANLGWGAGIGLSWILVLAGLITGRKNGWVWFFFSFMGAIVGAGLLYWIGSVVNGSAAYSLRYYFEATFAVCLVSAYGAVSWARAVRRRENPSPPQSPSPSRGEGEAAHAGHDYSSFPARRGEGEVIRTGNGISPFPTQRGKGAGGMRGAEGLRAAWRVMYPGYFVLLVACGLSLAGFTPVRFREPLPPDWPNGLWRYNKVGPQQIDAVNAMRADSPDMPVLILVLRSPVQGVKDNWRDYGATLAVTSPYMDSDIIVLRVFEVEKVEATLQSFSGRMVLYQIGEQLYRTVDEALAGAGQTGG